MASIPYEVVCVFTRNGKNGNHLAVFRDSSSLTSLQMQKIAQKINFSETAFVLPSPTNADYMVRFFTPKKELPFAGHPTIGTLFTLLHAKSLKKKKNYKQMIGRRLIELSLKKDGSIFMNQGRPLFGKAITPKEGSKIISLPENAVSGEPRVVSNGNPVIIIPLSSFNNLKEAKVNSRAYNRVTKALKASCIMPFVIHRGEVRCRMFAPALGIVEDPATGSGCGPLASYIVKNKLLGLQAEGESPMPVLQGVKPGGASLLFGSVFSSNRAVQRVEVGGFCKYLSRKTIDTAKL